MAIRDALVPVFGQEADETALAAVTWMSVFKDAHIAALLVAPLPEPILAGDGVGVGIAMTDVSDKVHVQAEAARKRLEARLANRGFEVLMAEAWAHLAADTAAIHARARRYRRACSRRR